MHNRDKSKSIKTIMFLKINLSMHEPKHKFNLLQLHTKMKSIGCTQTTHHDAVKSSNDVTLSTDNLEHKIMTPQNK